MRVSKPYEGTPKVITGMGIPGIDTQGFSEVGNSICIFTPPEERDTFSGPDMSVVGTDPQGLVKGIFSILKPAQLDLGKTLVMQCISEF